MTLGIKTKLTLVMTILAVAAGAGVGYLAYHVTSQELVKSEARALQTTRQTLSAYLETLVGNYRTTLDTQAGSPAVEDALAALDSAYKAFPGETQAALGGDLSRLQRENAAYYEESFVPLKAEITDWQTPQPPITPEGTLLQYAYITANPAALGSKSRNNLPTELTSFTNLPEAAAQTVAASAYSQALAKYQPFFDDLASSLELDDVLLINATGDVVYSIAKRFDFATQAGQAQNALGDVVRKTLAAPAEGQAVARVENSGIVLHRQGFDAPTLFLARPILGQGEKVEGLLVFVMNAGAFSRILFGELTASDSGTEAYLVGADGRLRSESQYCTRLQEVAKRPYFGANTTRLGETAVLRQTLDPERTRKAFESYIPESYANYLGDEVLGSAAELGDGSLGVALVVETPLAQLLAPVRSMGKTLLGVSGAAGVAAFLLALIIGRAVTSPLLALRETAGKVAAGHMQEKAPVFSGDEVGQLATQFNSMLDEINQQQAQTARIMATVNEALFLIDRDGRVLPQYSKETEEMFFENFGGTNLLDYLHPFISDKDFKTAQDYLGLLFSSKVKEKLIRQTNPLSEVELRMDDGRGGFRTKVLEFRFSRVVENSVVNFVMCTVLDATSRVLLTRQLKEAEKKASTQVELLFGIMHVEPAALREFLELSQSHLEKVSFHLRNEKDRAIEGETPDARSNRYCELLTHIQRPIHLLKGNAAMLRIDFFEQQAHAFEDTIRAVSEKTRLIGEDFVPITIQLGDMINLVSSTNEVIGRLSAMNAEFQKATTSSRQNAELSTGFNMSTSLSRFTGDLADSLGKKVALRVDENIEQIVPVAHHLRVQEILTQLVRNAVVHGIETPQLRLEHRKLPVGTVRINVKQTNGNYVLSVSDDGTGLDYAKIRERARELGYTNVESWGPQQLTEVIFAPGFSTAEQVTRHAGRGVGLDAVLDKVLTMGGQLEVAQKAGVECAFIMTFDNHPSGNN
jgi:signal transduction histidine kinase